MNSEAIKETIRSNAAEIVRLHTRIHETFRHRDEGELQRKAWEQACEEMHARYNSLAFPGGADASFLERIVQGDPFSVEAALCFLEVRPYFFRSGYMFQDIVLKCKRAPMSSEQKERFDAFLERYSSWKATRALSEKRGRAVCAELSPLLLHLYNVFPAECSAIHFDGVVTVRDLYVVLCSRLKVKPITSPESVTGRVLPPHNQTVPVWHPDAWKIYQAWRAFPWTPEDVWATLKAAITGFYKLDPAFVVEPHTVLRELDRN